MDPALPCAAQLCYTLPNLTHLLVSIGQELWDAGCIAIFDKDVIVITLHDTVLMSSTCHPVSWLWHLTILPLGFSSTIEPSPHIAAPQHLPMTTAAFANATRLSASPA
jgi:hypothetical protein